MRQERTGAAIAELETALDNDRCNREVAVNLARINRQIDNLDRTRAVYLAMLDCDPHDAQAMYNLGSLELESGSAAYAEAWFERAVATDGRYAAGHYGLALVRLREGNTEQAARSLRECLAVAEGDDTISHRAAMLLSDIEGREKRED